MTMLEFMKGEKNIKMTKVREKDQRTMDINKMINTMRKRHEQTKTV